MTDNQKIGARLAALRKAVGETQEDTAAATGVSRSSIANIETGQQDISLQPAIALADHFKVPLDYLLCRTVPPGGPLVSQFFEDRDVLALVKFWLGLDDRGRDAVVLALRIPDISRAVG
jgi:transcriptional regulator with XRE-family HTH domain